MSYLFQTCCPTKPALARLLILLLGLSFSGIDATAAGKTRKLLSRSKSSEVSEKDRKEARKRFQDRVDALTHYAVGISHELNNRRDQALESFLKSLEANPANMKLTSDVARRLLAKGDHKKTIRILGKVVKDGKPDAGVHAVLALAYQQTKKHEEALEAADKAIKLNPRIILPHRVKIQIHILTKNPDKALAAIDQAARVKETSVRFLIELGNLTRDVLQKHSKEFDANQEMLLSILRGAEKQNPRQPVFVQQLAEAFFFARDYKTSASLYLSLVNRYPTSQPFRRRLVEIYMRGDDRNGAIIQLESILRNRPTDPQANLIMGMISDEKREWEKAIDYFSKTKESAPHDRRAYLEIARLNLTLGKPEKALTILEETAKRFRQSYSTEFYRGLAYGQKKDYTKALEHYTGAEILAKENEPGQLQNYFFYFQFGVAAERNKGFKQAGQHFQKALELNPDSANTLNYLGYMWAERGENLEQAKKMIEKAVAAEPENSAYLDSMGWVLYMMGKHRASLPWLLKAVQNAVVEKEEDSTLYDHLADAYRKLGDYRKAIKHYEKAIALEAKPEIVDKLRETKKLLDS